MKNKAKAVLAKAKTKVKGKSSLPKIMVKTYTKKGKK